MVVTAQKGKRAKRICAKALAKNERSVGGKGAP